MPIKTSLILFIFSLFFSNTQAQFTTLNLDVGTLNSFVLNLKHPKIKISGITIERSINESYRSSIGVNLLLSTDYYLTKKWNLRAGFNYLQFDFTHAIDGIILGTDIMNGTKSSMESSGKRSEIGMFFDVFFRPKHKFEKKGFCLFTGFGFRKVLTHDIDRKWFGAAALDAAFYGKEYTNNAFNISARLGLKFDFSLTKKWHLAFLPYADFLLKGDEFIIFNFNKDRILHTGVLVEVSLLK